MVMFEGGGKVKPSKQPRVEKCENEEGSQNETLILAGLLLVYYVFMKEEIFCLENYDVEDSQALDEQNDFQIILGNEGNSSSPTTSATTTGKKRRMAIRGRGFSSYEDELICKCWLNISQDTSAAAGNVQKENRVNVNVLQDASAGGNNNNNNNLQRENRFYDRMRDVYNEGLEQTKHRSSKSIKQRWGVINKAVSKFCGYLSQIESRNQNEGVFQDMYEEARRMYSHYEEKNRSFAFELCWKILHGSPKWNEYRDSLGGAAAALTVAVVDLEGGGKAKEIPSTEHKELESCREQLIDSAKFELMNSQQAEVMYSVDVDSMADNSKAKEVRSNGHKKFESSRKQATDYAKFEARGSQQMELMKLVKDMCERNNELYERWMSSMNHMEEQKEKDRQEKAIERAQRNSLVAKQLEMITMQCEILKNAEQERLRREEERVLSIPLSNMDEFERQYYENRKREIVAGSSRSQAP